MIALKWKTVENKHLTVPGSKRSTRGRDKKSEGALQTRDSRLPVGL